MDQITLTDDDTRVYYPVIVDAKKLQALVLGIKSYLRKPAADRAWHVRRCIAILEAQATTSNTPKWKRGVPQGEGWYFWRRGKNILDPWKWRAIYIYPDDNAHGETQATYWEGCCEVHCPRGGWWMGPLDVKSTPENPHFCNPAIPTTV